MITLSGELGARSSVPSAEKKMCRKLKESGIFKIVKVEKYQEMPRAQLSLQP